jgi:hypothetical protein
MRSAVFALRGDGEAWLRRGLTALALMDVDRFDYRDFSMAVTLLHATAGRLGIKHGPLFKEALQLASPKTGSWFRGYITRKPPRDGVERSGMFRPIVTDDGPGYISSGFGALDLPNHVRSEDLSAIALDIADYLGRDDYEIDSVEVDGPVPEVWLASDDTRAAFLAAQKAVTAAASVHLHHRKGRGRKGSAQDLVIFGFLNRLKTEAAARTLLDLSRTKTRKDVALLGVQEKKLFLLLVAESIMHGVRPVETTESLRRFAKGLQTILRRHARAAARRR